MSNNFSLIVSVFRANIRHIKKEVVIMTKEEFKRELKYRLALSIAPEYAEARSYK